MARISATVSVWHLFATKAGKKQDQRLRLKPQKVVKFSLFWLENVLCRTNWVSFRGSSSMLTFPDWFSVYLTKHQVQAESRFMTSFYSATSVIVLWMGSMHVTTRLPIWASLWLVHHKRPKAVSLEKVYNGSQRITKTPSISVIQLLCNPTPLQFWWATTRQL